MKTKMKSGLLKRFVPTGAGVSQFPYFTMPVSDMKAWQLYVGQTMWLITLGVVFFIINMLVDMTFLKENKPVRKGLRIAEDISTGEGVNSTYLSSQFS